jgi:ABC-type multidrug transport system fused ATPase/permease subunit
MKGKLERGLRILGYARPYLSSQLDLLLALLLAMGLSLLDPLIIKYVIDKVLVQGLRSEFDVLMVALIGITAFGGLFRVIGSYIYSFVGQKLLFDIRNQLFRHLESQPPAFYASRRSGEIMSRVNSDVGALQELTNEIAIGVVTDLLSVAGVLAILLLIDWRMCLIALTVVPVFALVVVLFSKRIRRQSRRVREQVAEITAFFQEVLPAISLVQSYGREKHEADRLAARGREMISMRLRLTLLGSSSGALIGLVGSLAPLSVLWVGGRSVMAGTVTLGTLVAFYTYVGRLLAPIFRLAQLNVQVQTSLASVDRIFEYLDIEPQIKDRPGTHPVNDVAGAICFRHVTFAYEPDRPVLSDICLDVAPGQRVAVMGPSGAGKTTLANLLCRFYDPQGGQVTVDGVDIRDMTLSSLRRMIALVSQESMLFHASIRENLSYAREGVSDEEIVAASQAARLHDFVMGMPQRYDTIVGDRGVKLSGGQRQRIAIARAILKGARIVVFDEAMSSLDSEVERAIQETLPTLMRGRTAIMIAHRPSVASIADRIVVLDAGCVVDQGPHDVLVGRCELYRRLLNVMPLALRDAV